MSERLDMVSTNKLVGFFSDAYTSEWAYAKAVMVRKFLARDARREDHHRPVRHEACARHRAPHLLGDAAEPPRHGPQARAVQGKGQDDDRVASRGPIQIGHRRGGAGHAPPRSFRRRIPAQTLDSWRQTPIILSIGEHRARRLFHGEGRTLSKEDFFQPPCNFLGLPEELSSPRAARGWLLSIPYEGTTSYGAGTRNGPAAIIAAVRQVELYDREFGCDAATKYGVHTTNALWPVVSSPEAMVDAVDEAVTGILTGKPAPEVPGRPRRRALHLRRRRARPRPRSPERHARRRAGGCARGPARGIRRLALQPRLRRPPHPGRLPGLPDRHPQYLGRKSRFAVTCRSVKTVFSEEATRQRGEFLKDLASFVKGKSVFLTVDLDGLDPSIMPAVGTPEPGGISWERMLEIART